MVATQLRHADDPDRPPQPPYPLHYAKLNRICMQLSPVHAHPRVRDLRSGRALHCRPALLALIRVCRYSENAASPHLNVQSPRAVPSLPSRESVLRCAPPAGARSSTPSRKALSSTPPRRQPATRPPTPLTFGAQPTAPSLAHCQRPALPTVNTPRLPNLPPPSGAPRHKRRGIRSAASTEVPKPVGTPRRIPNRQRASRRRSPEHRHAPSQAPSRLDRTSSGGDAPGRKRSRRPLSQRTPPAIPPSAAPSDALPYALPPGWPPWSTLVASGCSFSVSMRTNPTISNGTTYRKMGTSASE